MEPTAAQTDADPLYAQALARLGTVVREKWRLDRLLGVGGMAAVFAATHRNGAKAAVKILHRELGLHAEVRARFLREGYVANTVEHPGTVKVEIPITLPRPRDPLSVEFLDVQKQLLRELGQETTRELEHA